MLRNREGGWGEGEGRGTALEAGRRRGGLGVRREGEVGGAVAEGSGSGLWARQEGEVGGGMRDRENLSAFIAPTKNPICT